MKRIFTIKKDIKRNIFSVISIFFLVSVVMFIYETKMRIYDINSASKTQMIFILISIIMGFLSIYKDEKNTLSSVISTTGNKGLYIFSKLTANFITVFIFTIFLYIICLIGILKLPDINKYFFYVTDSVKYMTLYYLIVGFTASVIGMIVGKLLPNKFGMVIATIVGLFIGPLGRTFIYFIPVLKNYELTYKILHYINIAQFSFHHIAEVHYLFETERILFFLKLFNLSISLIILFLIYIFNEKSNRKGIVKTFLFAILIFIYTIPYMINFNDYFVMLNGYDTPFTLANAEIRHHKVSENLTEIEEGKFTIDSIKGDIDIRKGFDFRGKVSITLKEDTDEIYFSLYHGLKVNFVKLDGKELDFSEDFYVRKVILDKKYSSGDKITLDLDYSGLTAQYFYAGDKAVFLPNYFNYLPYPGKNNAISGETNQMVVINQLYCNYPVYYEFDVKSYYDVEMNLEKDGSGFKGTSDIGVFIVGGNQEVVEIDGVKVIYEKSFHNNQDEIGRKLEIYKENRIALINQYGFDVKEPEYFINLKTYYNPLVNGMTVLSENILYDNILDTKSNEKSIEMLYITYFLSDKHIAKQDYKVRVLIKDLINYTYNDITLGNPEQSNNIGDRLNPDGSYNTLRILYDAKEKFSREELEAKQLKIFKMAKGKILTLDEVIEVIEE
ncbi:MAG: hypothetical protein CSB16_00795 [Clostridiales bacterium]|nr:MAG: hypothetical protein CSB16_00795 [Clostridiales bacterium]